MQFKSPIELVKQFNKSFDIITNKNPEVLQEEDWTLKVNLMKEELSEYIEACENQDIVAITDAIIDMQYILSGIVIIRLFFTNFEKL